MPLDAAPVPPLLGFLLLDAGSYAELKGFFRWRDVELDKATGFRLHLMDVGNPSVSRELYELARAEAARIGDAAAASVFVDEPLPDELVDPYRSRVMDTLAAILDVRAEQRPCIVFAGIGELETIARFPIEPKWYATLDARSMLVDALLDWIANLALDGTVAVRGHRAEFARTLDAALGRLRARLDSAFHGQRPTAVPADGRGSGLALLLAMLAATACAHDAVAAAPTFVGTFTSAGLCSPRGIGLSPAGDVFVGSDCLNQHHIEHFDAAGALLGTWGFFSRYAGPPNGVAVDGSGNVFVTDFEDGLVLKYTSAGGLVASWGGLSQPVDVAVDGAGHVFVAELTGLRVREFANNGAPLATFGSAGTGPGQFEEPVGIAVDASGRIYVADGARDRILRFLADGSFDMEFAPPAQPTDVAVAADGTIYVISFDVGEVDQYSSSGTLLLTFGSPEGLLGDYRIAIGPTGAMYVAEQYATRITKFQIDQVTAATRMSFGRVKAMYR